MAMRLFSKGDLHLDFRREQFLQDSPSGSWEEVIEWKRFRMNLTSMQVHSSVICKCCGRACFLPGGSHLVKMRLLQSHHVGFTCKQNRGNRSRPVPVPQCGARA